MLPMTEGYNWFCESCGGEQSDKPDAIQRVPTVEGWEELWFCAECTV